MRPRQAWAWACVFAALCAACLAPSWAAAPLLFAALLAYLAATRLCYALYNRIDTKCRAFLYPLMQAGKGVGLAVFLPAAPAGFLLLAAVLLVRQVRYVAYRYGQTRDALNIPVNLYIAACFLFLALAPRPPWPRSPRPPSGSPPPSSLPGTCTAAAASSASCAKASPGSNHEARANLHPRARRLARHLRHACRPEPFRRPRRPRSARRHRLLLHQRLPDHRPAPRRTRPHRRPVIAPVLHSPPAAPLPGAHRHARRHPAALPAARRPASPPWTPPPPPSTSSTCSKSSARSPPHLPGVPHPFGVLWSLAVEEHYYLFFPLLALVFARRR